MTKTTPVAIAADSPFTTQAGIQIAQQGGNAVDIAVAAALAATLSEILMCSVGGSAFLMIHKPGQPPELIDGADAMPSGHLKSDLNPAWEVHLPYGDGITVRAGQASVAVPGMLAALETAWQRGGSLPWAEIVAPALELARNGCTLGLTTSRWLTLAGVDLFFPQQASRDCFFPNGSLVREGELFQVPDMVQTLELIATEGAKALYHGDIAAAFVKEIGENGGFVTRSDLANYRAIVRQPLTLASQGFQLALNPPPGVGGAALGSLIQLLELTTTPDATPAQRTLQQAEAMIAFWQLRSQDVNLNPEVLLAEETLRRHLSAVQSPNTTHISVATASGELVAITMSNGYGSGITIPGTGIACNNSLGEPELNPQGFLAAGVGERMISNMAPTLAWHPDGRQLAIGSPGASRITTAIAQMWTRYTAEGYSLAEAVRASRLHVEPKNGQWKVLCEPGIETNLLKTKREKLEIYPFENLDMFFGAIKIAGIDRAGKLEAVADSRREGSVNIIP
ncbi:MAG: gamma-glutamyltransferase [Cyanobacteriota bacterium]|nr:gamma-glutamyltransferase [Cyanobacteriota bacterium]